jgi:ion channel-forming bestrophin family protein
MQHLLRGEAGAYYDDLFPLISFLPRFAVPDSAEPEDTLPLWAASDNFYYEHKSTPHIKPAGRTASALYQNTASTVKSLEKDRKVQVRVAADISDIESGSPVSDERPRVRSRHQHRHSVFDYFPILRTPSILLSLLGCRRRQRRESDIEENKPVLKQSRTFTGKKVKLEAADSNVPLEITLVLMTYCSTLMQRQKLTPAVATAMVNAIASLQDTVVHLQRIKTTPLPFAYQVHLKFSLWYVCSFISFCAMDELYVYPQDVPVLPSGEIVSVGS